MLRWLDGCVAAQLSGMSDLLKVMRAGVERICHYSRGSESESGFPYRRSVLPVCAVTSSVANWSEVLNLSMHTRDSMLLLDKYSIIHCYFIQLICVTPSVWLFCRPICLLAF